MPSINLVQINNHICHNTNLSIRNGELIVLVGYTGAGKTTLLNVIAGLVDYQGSVRFDDTVVDQRPPSQRHVGYLFQEFALFPHMSVQENIAFGLRARRWNKQRINTRVHELLSMLHMEHMADRYPRGLSGGEKQRVSLARTLAPQPKILLLDEPFSNLDPHTAKFLRLELKNLHQELGLTTVYVTHNQMEAFEMGDRIAVVSHGQIEQVSQPLRILFDPQTPTVADLFGMPNIFTCRRIHELHHGLGEAQCGELSLIIPYEGKTINKIAVLPSGISISRYSNSKPVPNQMQGIIVAVQKRSPVVMVEIRVKTETIKAELPEHVWDKMSIGVEETVYATIPLRYIQTMES